MPPARVTRLMSFKVAVMTATTLSILWTAGLDTVFAQRPFFANDPLYRDETARRTYDHGYAISGEVSYRPIDASASGTASNLGVLFRVDLELAKQFDVSAIVDAYGGLNAQSLRLSWLSVRHQWYSDGADMAVRLAFEPRPAIGGGLGFRQTDVAFFYSKPLSPTVETEIALGARHVRTGFSTFDPALELFDLTEMGGYEAHIVLAYNMIFDPAKSHVSLAFGYEAGRYDVVERAVAPAVPTLSEFAGHTLWIQTGVHWNRPSYQLVPFVSVPLVSGKRGNGFQQGKGPRYVNVGVRVTLR